MLICIRCAKVSVYQVWITQTWCQFYRTHRAGPTPDELLVILQLRQPSMPHIWLASGVIFAHAIEICLLSGLRPGYMQGTKQATSVGHGAPRSGHNTGIFPHHWYSAPLLMPPAAASGGSDHEELGSCWVHGFLMVFILIPWLDSSSDSRGTQPSVFSNAL